MTLRYDPNGRTFITDEGDHIGYLRLNALDPTLGYQMAAGPKMFEALSDLLPYFEGEHHPDHPQVVAARAALERAKP